MKRWQKAVVWFVIILVSVGFSAAQEDETQYFAVFMGGKKVGHSIQRRVVSGGEVKTSEEVNITMSRMNIPLSMHVVETCIETVGGKPLGFESVQEMSLMQMKVSGRLDQAGTVHLSVESMGQVQEQTMVWPQGAVMAEGLRLLTLKKGLKQGQSYLVRVFSPQIMQAVDAEVRIGAKEKVDILGRVMTLRKVVTASNIPGAGQIVSESYVDEQLRVQKQSMPLIGIQIEIISCPKEFALGSNELFDVVAKMFVPSPRVLRNLDSAESVRYYLQMTDKGGDLSVPVTDNQKVRRLADGEVMVTVRPVPVPRGGRFPYKGSDASIREAMAPTRFLQSDNAQIVELARRAVGSTADMGEAARQIEDFVAGYIANKNLSIGYASAAEVADSREGDCTEFAVLTAAMCRAVGIPAQVVMGVVYVDEFGGLEAQFGGHAWVQAYVKNRWVGLDAAFVSAGRGGYGPGHIALAVGNGDPEDFFELIKTVGRFRIDRVEVKRRR